MAEALGNSGAIRRRVLLFLVVGLLIVVFAHGVMVVEAAGLPIVGPGATPTTTATWCVARSNVSEQALQTALDYACGSGADCAPIQSNGLCFLPNTIQAHASYAFNSYYQRRTMAPGACDFAGTATIAMTDPSYGSCVYPSSSSSAGGTIIPSPTMTPTITNPNAPMTPATTTPTIGGGVGGFTPGLGPTTAGSGTPYGSQSSLLLAPSLPLTLLLMTVMSIFVLPPVSKPFSTCFS